MSDNRGCGCLLLVLLVLAFVGWYGQSTGRTPAQLARDAARVADAVVDAPKATRKPAVTATRTAKPTPVTRAPRSSSPVAARPFVPAPVPDVVPDQAAGEALYFTSCAAAKAAGKAPLRKGRPGYRVGLDRDGDGVACE